MAETAISQNFSQQFGVSVKSVLFFPIVPAIPEDPQAAEAFYFVDEFESCSEEDSDGEEDPEDNLPTDPSCQTCGQVRRDPPPQRSSCQSVCVTDIYIQK